MAHPDYQVPRRDQRREEKKSEERRKQEREDERQRNRATRRQRREVEREKRSKRERDLSFVGAAPSLIIPTCVLPKNSKTAPVKSSLSRKSLIAELSSLRLLFLTSYPKPLLLFKVPPPPTSSFVDLSPDSFSSVTQTYGSPFPTLCSF